MSARAEPARPQTIKQAKAAYKARSGPPLTEAQRKQLERAAELDRRAWRAQEANKKKAEGTKKRLEKEKKEREERTTVQMGSQRRCDKFGYKSSQMHLGAFLNKGAVGKVERKENFGFVNPEEDDDFGDEDLDDETLLDACFGTVEDRVRDIPPPAQPTVKFSSRSMHLPELHGKSTVEDRVAPERDDFAAFLDDLDSSTQIARELDAEEPRVSNSEPIVPPSRTLESFDPCDFELSAEELEELTSLPAVQKKAEEDKKLMPPPPLPSNSLLPSWTTMDSNFTMSELEQLADFDVQLTQSEPG